MQDQLARSVVSGCAAMGDSNASVQASAQAEDLVSPAEWSPEFGRQVAAVLTRLDKKQTALESLIADSRADMRTEMASKEDIQSLKDAIASLKPVDRSLPQSGMTSTPGSASTNPSAGSLPIGTTPAAFPLPLIPQSIAGADSTHLRRLLPPPQKFDKVCADYDFTLWQTCKSILHLLAFLMLNGLLLLATILTKRLCVFGNHTRLSCLPMATMQYMSGITSSNGA